MLIKKNMKASDIAFYKSHVLPQVKILKEGSYATIADNSLVIFAAASDITDEEVKIFEYGTKKMGYITNNNGMISLITDDSFVPEVIFYPYPHHYEAIKEGVTNISVILIDTKKDKVLSVKMWLIPEIIQQKLKEQWFLSIEKGITFNQYQRWVDTTLYSHTCDYNVSVAADKQIVKEHSNVFLYLPSEDESKKIS